MSLTWLIAGSIDGSDIFEATLVKAGPGFGDHFEALAFEHFDSRLTTTRGTLAPIFDNFKDTLRQIAVYRERLLIGGTQVHGQFDRVVFDRLARNLACPMTRSTLGRASRPIAVLKQAYIGRHGLVLGLVKGQIGYVRLAVVSIVAFGYVRWFDAVVAVDLRQAGAVLVHAKHRSHLGAYFEVAIRPWRAEPSAARLADTFHHLVGLMRGRASAVIVNGARRGRTHNHATHHSLAAIARTRRPSARFPFWTLASIAQLVVVRSVVVLARVRYQVTARSAFNLAQTPAHSTRHRTLHTSHKSLKFN